MSQRANSNSRRPHSREPNTNRQPPNAPPRLPSLRSLTASRESRERENGFPSRRWWTTNASLRAERIRNLDNDLRSFENHRSSALFRAWSPDPRPPDNIENNTRAVDEAHRTFDYPPSPETTSRIDEFRRVLNGDPDRMDERIDEMNRETFALNERTRRIQETTGEIERLLRETNDLAGTLSVEPSAPRHSPPPPHRPTDPNDDNRRNKRRKLDSGRSKPRSPPLRYGKYGQVEPGQLNMEVVSCDGGVFQHGLPAVHNILKNDSSVYCTKGNRCNIVLRHQGETPFTLKEITIKGPASMNFSHPIREGMVFVAMNSDEILQRTAKYHIQYATMPKSRTSRPHDDSELRRSLYRRNDGTDTPRRPRANRRDDEDYRIAQMPPEFSTSQPNIGVSTECSDENERHAPNRIGSLPFEDTYSDDEDGSEDRDLHGLQNNAFNADDFSWTERALAEPHDDNLSIGYTLQYVQGNLQSPGAELLAPHARFFIEKKKSTCTIRFDPPVSGRFILLKMWNSHHDPSCNIDIQSVITKGFAGPRFFPAVQLR